MIKNKKLFKIERKLRNIRGSFLYLIFAAIYILLYRTQFKKFGTNIPKTVHCVLKGANEIKTYHIK